MTIPAEIQTVLDDAQRGHRIHEYERLTYDLVGVITAHFNGLDREPALKGPVSIDVANENLLGMSQWLDGYNAHKPVTTQLWERIGKVGEENGEVIGAMIGWGGQNPRKGRTHSEVDVEKELYDVAITALGAIVHLHGNDENFDVLDRLFGRLSEIDNRRRGAERLEGGDFNRRHDYIMGEAVR